MKKLLSSLCVVAFTLCATAQTTYVVKQTGELASGEEQLSIGNFGNWNAGNAEYADIEGGGKLTFTNTQDNWCGGGWTLAANLFNSTLYNKTGKLEFEVMGEGNGATYDAFVKPTVPNHDTEYTIAFDKDGQWHQMSLDIKTCFPAFYGFEATGDANVFAFGAHNFTVGQTMSVRNIKWVVNAAEPAPVKEDAKITFVGTDGTKKVFDHLSYVQFGSESYDKVDINDGVITFNYTGSGWGGGQWVISNSEFDIRQIYDNDYELTFDILTENITAATKLMLGRQGQGNQPFVEYVFTQPTNNQWTSVKIKMEDIAAIYKNAYDYGSENVILFGFTTDWSSDAKVQIKNICWQPVVRQEQTAGVKFYGTKLFTATNRDAETNVELSYLYETNEDGTFNLYYNFDNQDKYPETGYGVQEEAGEAIESTVPGYKYGFKGTAVYRPGDDITVRIYEDIKEGALIYNMNYTYQSASEAPGARVRVVPAVTNSTNPVTFSAYAVASYEIADAETTVYVKEGETEVALTDGTYSIADQAPGEYTVTFIAKAVKEGTVYTSDPVDVAYTVYDASARDYVYEGHQTGMLKDIKCYHHEGNVPELNYKYDYVITYTKDRKIVIDWKATFDFWIMGFNPQILYNGEHNMTQTGSGNTPGRPEGSWSEYKEYTTTLNGPFEKGQEITLNFHAAWDNGGLLEVNVPYKVGQESKTTVTPEVIVPTTDLEAVAATEDGFKIALNASEEFVAFINEASDEEKAKLTISCEKSFPDVIRHTSATDTEVIDLTAHYPMLNGFSAATDNSGLLLNVKARMAGTYKMTIKYDGNEQFDAFEVSTPITVKPTVESVGLAIMSYDQDGNDERIPFINNGVIYKLASNAISTADAEHVQIVTADDVPWETVKLQYTLSQIVSPQNVSFAAGEWINYGANGVDLAHNKISGLKITQNGIATNELPVEMSDVTVGVETIGAEDIDGNAVYFDLNGVLVKNPTSGIYVRIQNNSAKIIVVE